MKRFFLGNDQKRSLSFRFEAYNVFNHTQWSGFNGTPTFNQQTGAITNFQSYVPGQGGGWNGYGCVERGFCDCAARSDSQCVGAHHSQSSRRRGIHTGVDSQPLGRGIDRACSGSEQRRCHGHRDFHEPGNVDILGQTRREAACNEMSGSFKLNAQLEGSGVSYE